MWINTDLLSDCTSVVRLEMLFVTFKLVFSSPYNLCTMVTNLLLNIKTPIAKHIEQNCSCLPFLSFYFSFNWRITPHHYHSFCGTKRSHTSVFAYYLSRISVLWMKSYLAQRRIKYNAIKCHVHFLILFALRESLTNVIKLRLIIQANFTDDWDINKDYVNL